MDTMQYWQLKGLNTSTSVKGHTLHTNFAIKGIQLPWKPTEIKNNNKQKLYQMSLSTHETKDIIMHLEKKEKNK